jgi:large subunit ribosomal protein L22
MSRSVKKGPFVEPRLLGRVQAMNKHNEKKVVKTWSRASVIFPDFIGHTVAVYNGRKHVPPRPAPIAATGSTPTGRRHSSRSPQVRVSATAKYVRGSTRRARLITQAIKGKRVEEATALLQFMPQAAARDVALVLKSATANAENNHNLSAEDLVVADAQANEAPTIKRWRPRARGAAFHIHKPMTHITIVVEDREA